jgi:hypothetical protein
MGLIFLNMNKWNWKLLLRSIPFLSFFFFTFWSWAYRGQDHTHKTNVKYIRTYYQF